jgi:phage-related protein
VHIAQELFPRLLNIIKELTPVAIDFLKAIIDNLPDIEMLANLILDVVVPAMVAFVQSIDETWPYIKAVITSVLTYIQGFVNLIMGLLTGDWDRAWQGIKQIVSGAIDAAKNTVKLGLVALLDSFIGLPVRIVSALAGLPNSLFSSGQAMMRGLADGIKSMIQTVINSVKSVVDKARGLFPFSPAKTGPFSGRGYTTYSGRALMEDWAKGIQEGTPTAVAAVEEAMAATQTGMDITAAVTSEGFGDIQSQIASAMSGWEVVIDANGITKMVNKTNSLSRRR